MIKIKITFTSFILCLFCAIGWIYSPLFLQKFLYGALNNMSGTSWYYAVLSLVSILIAAVVDYFIFINFSVNKPTLNSDNSIAARLAQDRLWVTAIPNFFTNIFIIIGSLIMLLSRDIIISCYVTCWIFISYIIQTLFSKKIDLYAKKLMLKELNEDEVLCTQMNLLKWQNIGNSVSTLLRISGNIFILFIIFVVTTDSTELSQKLPIIMANFEYVSMMLGCMQNLLSLLPRIVEFNNYIETKNSFIPKVNIVSILKKTAI